MNISLRQLRCFVTVAQQQSFTQAAQALHTTQSAVSVTIKELEDEVGFRLFDRTTRQVVLSEAGQNLFRHANRLLDEFQVVLQDVSDIAALRKGIVRVGATEAAACSLVIPAIAAYQRENPGIDVKLVVTLVSSMFGALRNGDVDFIIGPDSMHEDEIDRSIAVESLARSPLWAWCLASHPLARLKSIPWQALLQHDLVIPAMDFTSRIIPAIVQDLGVARASHNLFDSQASRRTVSNITAALSMVQSDLGVTFAAEYIRPLGTAFGLVGRPLVKPELERVLVMYSRRGRTLAPAAEHFADFFRRFAAARVSPAREGARSRRIGRGAVQDRTSRSR
jgi:DNA-binding transcriptional LysR family regulator